MKNAEQKASKSMFHTLKTTRPAGKRNVTYRGRRARGEPRLARKTCPERLASPLSTDAASAAAYPSAQKKIQINRWKLHTIVMRGFAQRPTADTILYIASAFL